MEAVLNWLKEKTTIVGILTVLAGAIGLETSDKLVGDVAEAITLVLGSVLMYLRDRDLAKQQ